MQITAGLICALPGAVLPAVAWAGTTADARLLPPGAKVTVTATISSTVDLIDSPNNKNFYIQDDFGGLTVFGTNAVIDGLLAQSGGLRAGDTITMTGYTECYNALLELVGRDDDPLVIVSKEGSPGVPAPAKVTLSDLADGSATGERWESRLVTLHNVQFSDTGTFSGRANYTVSADGADEGPVATIRIATMALDLVGQPIPTGRVDITGLLTQYAGGGNCASTHTGYQLQPRGMLDIVAHGSISALGAATPDPVYAGNQVVLTVSLAGGTPPYTVTGNLTAIGGEAAQAFCDDGTQGDVTADDLTFTHVRSLACGVAAGETVIPLTVRDSGTPPIIAHPVIRLTVYSGAPAFGTVYDPQGPPYDDGQPRNATRCPGETATFSVFARGGNLRYQWHNARGPLSSGGKISGADSATLRIDDVQPEDAGAGPYFCVVSGCGPSRTTDPATLTIGTPATDVDKQVVISQVYGGGNAGSIYAHDFIELFNRGAAPVDLTGWSVQYAGPGIGGTQPAFDRPARITLLSGIIQPGQFCLIQEAPGTSGGAVPLPTPDVDGGLQPNGGFAIRPDGGKVALVKVATSLAEMGPYGNGAAPTACSIVDFVGWGLNAGCAEGGTPAPAAGITTAVVRKSTCPDLVDTDNNGQDFEAAPPLPRNRAFPPAPTIVTQPADQLACPGWTATFRVKATGVCITSWQWQVHAGNGWADVTTGTGADTPEYTTPLLSLEENGNRYRCVVTNAHGSTASEAATLSIGLTPADRQITITQIYGGGGNLNATYQNDFIELFNRGATPVDLSGWSVQYASDKGSNWTNRIHLAGAIQPGRYFLIQAAAGKSCAGAACGEPLPVTPDATGSVNLGSGAGKIALVKSTEPLTGSCPDDCRIVDLVGYGKTASCFEGLLGPAPSGSSTQAIIRKGGCAPRDVNSNAADFELGPVNPRNSTSPDCGPCHRPYADADGDGDVDQADFGAFQECFSGHGGGIRMGPAYACDCFDRDGPAATGDGDVDEADWEQFSHCAEDSGPNIPWNPANPACLP